MNDWPGYYRYWGKTDRDDPDRYHPLVYHCLDVAAVVSVWWENRTVIGRAFIDRSGFLRLIDLR